MESKEEIVIHSCAEQASKEQPLLAGNQVLISKDNQKSAAVPFFDSTEFFFCPLWRQPIAEFFATFIFVCITTETVIGNFLAGECNGVGTEGIARAFGGVMFALVYCSSGVPGGIYTNPAVTFGLLLARKLSIPRTLICIAAQICGGIAGALVAKRFQTQAFEASGGGTKFVRHGYTTGDGLGAEIMGTFLLLYVAFTAKDANMKAQEPHVQVLAPLASGFAVFLVHLATIPITGPSINVPARTLGVAIAYQRDLPWKDYWIFWVGPFLGAPLAAMYNHFIIQAVPSKGKINSPS